MHAALAPRGDARTYLNHLVGGGLQDDRYVVEAFRSLANTEIVPVGVDGIGRPHFHVHALAPNRHVTGKSDGWSPPPRQFVVPCCWQSG